MRPEYAQKLLRLLDLIAKGELPVTSAPRLMYQGARVVHTYGRTPEDESFKCVTCKTEGVGRDFTCGCPDPEVYCTNFLHTARWECTCGHQWDGEDGSICPQCYKPW